MEDISARMDRTNATLMEAHQRAARANAAAMQLRMGRPPGMPRNSIPFLLSLSVSSSGNPLGKYPRCDW